VKLCHGATLVRKIVFNLRQEGCNVVFSINVCLVSNWSVLDTERLNKGILGSDAYRHVVR